MPLVDPVTMGTAGKDFPTQWLNKIAGKKIGDVTNETVGTIVLSASLGTELMQLLKTDFCKNRAT